MITDVRPALNQFCTYKIQTYHRTLKLLYILVGREYLLIINCAEKILKPYVKKEILKPHTTKKFWNRNSETAHQKEILKPYVTHLCTLVRYWLRDFAHPPATI